jgi:hypothetical protein
MDKHSEVFRSEPTEVGPNRKQTENRREQMNLSDYDALILKNGGRRDFWVSHVDIIEQYIKSAEKELIRVRESAKSPAGLKADDRAHATAAGKAIIWDPTRGGMRMPHLHYAGEIYILNESQWATFSKSAMKALIDNLGKVKKVTFENVMQVSEALAQM